jgi:chromosome partitioning protein
VRTLAIMSSKGGTGKTTVALHLAAAAATSGRKVLVADLDPQKSACEWRRDRRSPKPAVIETRHSCLFISRQAAERGGMDLMILDTAPTAGEEAVAAMQCADLSLIVVRPSALDLRAIARTVEMAKRLNRPAVLVLNQAAHRRNGKEPAATDRAVEMLRAYGLPIAPTGIRSRAAYQQALGAGLVAQELDPRGPAAAEIRALWRFVSKTLWQPQPALQPLARPRFDHGRSAPFVQLRPQAVLQSAG